MAGARQGASPGRGCIRCTPSPLSARLHTGISAAHAAFRALEDHRDPVGLPGRHARRRDQPGAALGPAELVPRPAGKPRPRPSGRLVPAARGRPQHGGPRAAGRHGGRRAHAAAHRQCALHQPQRRAGEPAHGIARARCRADPDGRHGAARTGQSRPPGDRAGSTGHRRHEQPRRPGLGHADRSRPSRQGQRRGRAIHRNRPPPYR
jgi:hypothetical protein